MYYYEGDIGSMKRTFHDIINSSNNISGVSNFNIKCLYDFRILSKIVSNQEIGQYTIDIIKQVFYMNLSDGKIYAIEHKGDGTRVKLIPEDLIGPRSILHQEQTYMLDDFIKSIIDVYNGTVKEVGPSIVTKDNCRYINLHECIMENTSISEVDSVYMFACAVIEGRICEWLQQRAYSITEVYSMYMMFVNTNQYKCATVKAFSALFRQYLYDISAKSPLLKIIQPDTIPIGAIVRSTVTTTSHVCYYIYPGATLPRTKSIVYKQLMQ